MYQFSKPIAIVRFAYALVDFTFGHEAGHILGGLHNREFYTRQGRDPPHHYSYGYMLPNTNTRTIMSYVQITVVHISDYASAQLFTVITVTWGIMYDLITSRQTQMLTQTTRNWVTTTLIIQGWVYRDFSITIHLQSKTTVLIPKFVKTGCFWREDSTTLTLEMNGSYVHLVTNSNTN